jgi:hypothetical protein
LEFEEAARAVIEIYEANHGMINFDDLCHEHGLNALQVRMEYNKRKESE